MNQSELTAYLEECQQRVDRTLSQHLQHQHSPFADIDSQILLSRLTEAMQYSSLDGGKRLRPALLYAAAQWLGAKAHLNTALDYAAAAVECIHAYSLIHDDLPAMDNDALRRGKATCHIQFDEATAILAGDALQTEAFALLADCPNVCDSVRLALVKALALAAGRLGMVGGQQIDLDAVDCDISVDHLSAMHALKTGAMIRVSVQLAALICGADKAQQHALDNFAKDIGLAFQVHDDVIDLESDTQTLGKTQGSDSAQNKPTYPALLGLAAAKTKAKTLHDQALTALREHAGDGSQLTALADFIIQRRY